MLAERLVGLLPPLTPAEALTVTRIHSAAGCALPDGELLERPPFRAPHHQAVHRLPGRRRELVAPAG